MVKFTCEGIRSRTCVCLRFFDYYFTFISRNHVFRFSVSSWFSLGIVCFHALIPVFHIVQFVPIIFSYNSLNFSGVSCYFSFCISNFIYLGPLFFFSFKSLVKGLLILFIFSKNQILDLLILWIVLLLSMSFNSVNSFNSFEKRPLPLKFLLLDCGSGQQNPNYCSVTPLFITMWLTLAKICRQT